MLCPSALSWLSRADVPLQRVRATTGAAAASSFCDIGPLSLLAGVLALLG